MEYVYPILGIKVWEEIDKVWPTVIDMMFMEDEPLPFRAAKECWKNPTLKDVRGEKWAKVLIDQYHKLYDEAEWKPIVEYIKYPD